MPDPSSLPLPRRSRSASLLPHYLIVTAEKRCHTCGADPGETCHVSDGRGGWRPAPPWMKSICVKRGVES